MVTDTRAIIYSVLIIVVLLLTFTLMYNTVPYFHHQLGTFFVNGEWACSPFVTKSGHADNPATFVPCVKSMMADFISQIHNVPHGGLPYNFVRRRIFVT